jgi:hypothetical protein
MLETGDSSRHGETGDARSGIMRWLPVFVSVALATGCGGGGGSDEPANPAIPANAVTLDNKLRALGLKHVRKIVVLESSLLAVFVPSSPLSQGVVVTPAGAPLSFTLSGSYDGNLDGLVETTLDGSATFGADPDSDWNGMQGRLSVRTELLSLMHVAQSDVDFSVTSDQRRFSGTSTYTEPMGGDTLTLSVAAGAPLVVQSAANGAPANVCGYNVSGEMSVAIEGLLGRYTAIWRFLGGASAVTVAGATYRDSSGQTTQLPDATMDLRCGSNIADWVGTFSLDWACLPRESGNWRVRFSVKDASTLTITDADDNDSFDAQIVGVSAHALRGFFIAGPVGSQYREDFVWTLAAHGNEFTQVTKYTFIEGAQQGRGGVCIGRAKREP